MIRASLGIYDTDVKIDRYPVSVYFPNSKLRLLVYYFGIACSKTRQPAWLVPAAVEMAVQCLTYSLLPIDIIQILIKAHWFAAPVSFQLHLEGESDFGHQRQMIRTKMFQYLESLYSQL